MTFHTIQTDFGIGTGELEGWSTGAPTSADQAIPKFSGTFT
jgi:hypothetical protein